MGTPPKFRKSLSYDDCATSSILPIADQLGMRVVVKDDVGNDGRRGKQGLRGPQGLSAYEIAVENGFTGTEAQWLLSLAGDFHGSTDGVPEGATNLYFTTDRAAAVAIAAVDSGIALHMLHPDPHPQYIDDDDVVDGGNF